ncbi:hypothetical protein K7432_010487 [Basidiobolus ranarum]|uniref:Uncharacterized protein n=1 Tax=Basidiobolus ranarum TaxID=34480 RepID=A0ABR2VVC6_9FUNG
MKFSLAFLCLVALTVISAQEAPPSPTPIPRKVPVSSRVSDRTVEHTGSPSTAEGSAATSILREEVDQEEPLKTNI